MRVISGRYSGRTVKSPDDKDLRPTAGRTKQAMFNMLMHGVPSADGTPVLIGARAADICCGSGALGIEALSRGAAFVTFVDANRKNLAVAEQNILTIITDTDIPANFLAADCKALPSATLAYDLIFVDPPYGKQLQNAAHLSLEKRGWVKDGTVVVSETDKMDPPVFNDAWTILKERMYGKSRVTIAMYGDAGRAMLDDAGAQDDDVTDEGEV